MYKKKRLRARVYEYTYISMYIFILILSTPVAAATRPMKGAQWRNVATGGQTGPLGTAHLHGDHLHGPSCLEAGGRCDIACAQLAALPKQGDTQLPSRAQRAVAHTSDTEATPSDDGP